MKTRKELFGNKMTALLVFLADCHVHETDADGNEKIRFKPTPDVFYVV
jgi:hypothetical protein